MCSQPKETITPNMCEINAARIQKYGFDPRNAKSILERLNNETVNLYELAPPGVWLPYHMAVFLEKLVGK